MNFGLTASEYQWVLREIVLPLERLGAEVWCYGSRARGDHKDFSDLDLMVELPARPDSGREQERTISLKIGELQEKLSNSSFPYKADLVVSADFAESYRDGYLKDRVRFKAGV